VSTTYNTVCDWCVKSLNRKAHLNLYYSPHSEEEPFRTGKTKMVPAIHIIYPDPPFDGTQHFCSFKCLKTWIDQFGDNLHGPKG
jgi:hypothetical protein